MRPFTLSASKVAASSASTTLYTERVPNDMEAHIVSVMARDVNSDVSTSIEIGIMDGSAEIPVDSTAGTFPANTSHNISFGFSLHPGQRVYAKFNNATAGDRLELNAHGFSKFVGCEDKDIEFIVEHVRPHVKGR